MPMILGDFQQVYQWLTRYRSVSLLVPPHWRRSVPVLTLTNVSFVVALGAGVGAGVLVAAISVPVWQNENHCVCITDQLYF